MFALPTELWHQYEKIKAVKISLNCFIALWYHQESNRGHKANYRHYQSFALPTELRHQHEKIKAVKISLNCFIVLWYHQESNRGHKDFQSFALPTELWHQHVYCAIIFNCGCKGMDFFCIAKLFRAKIFPL